MVRYPELAARVVLVTGAARGIGRGLGARVRRAGLRRRAQRRPRGRGPRDGGRVPRPRVRRRRRRSSPMWRIGTRAQAMVAALIERHGRLDVLAANAGINPTSSFLELGQDVWERIAAHQHVEPLPLRAAGGASDGDAGGGQHPRHRFARVQRDVPGSDALRHCQGRAADARLGHGLGARAARDPHQHRAPGLDRDGAQPRVPVGGSRAPRAGRRADPAAHARDCRPTWRGRRSGSRATRRPTSTARPSRSTAAWSWGGSRPEGWHDVGQGQP